MSTNLLIFFAVCFYSRTVDRLWSITEDLNILYKENWTRLAAQEVQQFQVIDIVKFPFSFPFLCVCAKKSNEFLVHITLAFSQRIFIASSSAFLCSFDAVSKCPIRPVAKPLHRRN